MRAATNDTLASRPILMRLLVRSREYRHPQAWTRIRIAAGVFNLVLGAALLTAGHVIGYWVGALPLAASVLIFWTASRLRHSVQS